MTQLKRITHGTFGLVNAGVALMPLLVTFTPPAATRGVIISFLKSSLVIGCSDLKQSFHPHTTSSHILIITHLQL